MPLDGPVPPRDPWLDALVSSTVRPTFQKSLTAWEGHVLIVCAGVLQVCLLLVMLHREPGVLSQKLCLILI